MAQTNEVIAEISSVVGELKKLSRSIRAVNRELRQAEMRLKSLQGSTPILIDCSAEYLQGHSATVTSTYSGSVV